MTNTFHERQGTGAMREIPPTTQEGRITALECRFKDFDRRLRDCEHEIRKITQIILLGGDVGTQERPR